MTHVLLVEDDSLLAYQYGRTLTRAGMTSVHAQHAGEAISLVDERLPDVIVLDMLLPVTSGFALLHELQSYRDTAGVPVIVCTTMADSLSLQELRPYGVRRLLNKVEMEPADLVSAVKAVL